MRRICPEGKIFKYIKNINRKMEKLTKYLSFRNLKTSEDYLDLHSSTMQQEQVKPLSQFLSSTGMKHFVKMYRIEIFTALRMLLVTHFKALSKRCPYRTTKHLSFLNDYKPWLSQNIFGAGPLQCISPRCKNYSSQHYLFLFHSKLERKLTRDRGKYMQL